MSVQSMPAPAGKQSAISGFHIAFVVAWFFCLLFYFMQYAVRSAPSVMIPELTTAFGLTTLGVSSLLGLYYYTYSTFAIIAGASLDRWGAKYTIPIGVFFLAIGIVMFGMGISWAADVGRLLQGARTASPTRNLAPMRAMTACVQCCRTEPTFWTVTRIAFASTSACLL